MGGSAYMLPKVNQILHLQIASSDEEESRVDYKSRLAEISSDRFLIELPMNESTGRLKKLYLGDELSVYFVTEGGVKNYFISHVLGFQEDVIRLAAIQRPEPESITQVQRRSFLRVGAELEIAIKLSDHINYLGITDDIGGGGISFISEGKYPVKVGDGMGCWLLLPYKNGTLEHANFKGEIVRVKKLETGRNQVMLKFTEITDGERQKIIRFCFERQLELRK
jgi:c-di-GMP-binding flagellar brake protein YcgR